MSEKSVARKHATPPQTRAGDAVKEIETALTVRRVFGAAIQSNGITVVPVARVYGAAGGGSRTGSGKRTGGRGDGWGGGFAVLAEPVGVYVIEKHDVRWMPLAAHNPLLALLAGASRAVISIAARIPKILIADTLGPA
jgi:uncharacterized spore protein YtfJ